MSFLASFFGPRKPSAATVKEIPLDDFIYRVDFDDHYKHILSGCSDRPKVLTELLLYRAWTTQLGFRIFSAYPAISEQILREVVGLTNTLGRAMLELGYKVTLDRLFDVDFPTLVETRWRQYDLALQANSTEAEPLAPNRVCAVLTDRYFAGDPLKNEILSLDYVFLMGKVQVEARKHRILP